MIQKATFGAGCFWGVEQAFSKLGKTTVGYMGGEKENPTYEDVCTDQTGHVEVVQIKFDPSKVSYEKLLDLFWKIHDPTQLNRQGPDIGTQYKSIIFYHSKKQEMKALKSKKEIQNKFKDKITTQIKKASTFYKAEEYHQKYLQKHGAYVCGSHVGEL